MGIGKAGCTDDWLGIGCVLLAAPEISLDTAFQFAKKNGVQAFYWVDGDLGYVRTGAVNRSVISCAARVVYDQLNG